MTGLTHKDCLRIYLQQATFLWSAGSLTRRERHLLDRLRAGLRLSVSEAARIESRAARAVATPEEIRAQNELRPLHRQPLHHGPWPLQSVPDPDPHAPRYHH